jgi:acyl-coenzyme A synthetase/AMP-(fatty) acid ligase
VTAPLRLDGVPFAAALAGHGDRVALVDGEDRLTFAALAARVEDVVAALGSTRRLVLLHATPDLPTVVAYLACLAAGHPVLVTEDRAADGLLRAYDPDVVASRDGLQVRRDGTAHDLHPDLALLLSTSGSTGSPKLVRLSRENLQANAAAIVASLGTRADDVAVSALPLHYCYGLSVLHSHLLAGAATVLTDRSVVDPCFWDLLRREGVTTLPGVPHTFTLLDRVGFADQDLPRLRLLTQAGGRLAPEQVRRYAELGQRRGFDLAVMYGQTEATARMAVLPPDLARTHPTAVGFPVPGGAFVLDPVDEGDELVFTGPHVMLGYATSPADLALGRTVTELRTGDLARRTSDGLVELVGRRSRFLKVLGKRIDLDRVEQQLREAGHVVACDGTDDRLVVAATARGDVRRAVLAATGLPPAAVHVARVDELPRTPSGKVDGAAVRALAPAADPTRPATVREVFALVLERSAVAEDVPDDASFVDLGGDSLSYVEASLRLEEVLGTLPAGWHLMPVRALERAATSAPRRGRAVETGLLVRALAIVLVVANHTEAFTVVGGAHLLLGLAGFNVARFHLAGRGRRIGELVRACARVVLPTVAAAAFTGALTGWYSWQHLLLVQDLVDPAGPYHHYWFVEVLLQLTLLSGLLLAIPWVGRLNERRPLVVPLVLLAVALLARYGVLPAGTGEARLYGPAAVAWLFVWGWAAARATNLQHRLLLSGVLLGAIDGFFFNRTGREVLVALGLLAVLWWPTVRLPRRAVPVVGLLAGASLFVYVSHYWVMSSFHQPWLAFGLSFVVGVGYQRLWGRLAGRCAGWRRRDGTLVGVAHPPPDVRPWSASDVSGRTRS